MDFTTTTNLARNGKKEFDHGIKIVMYNNQDIGLVVGKDFYEAMKDNGIIDQIREEMWEMHDPETMRMIDLYNKNDRSNALDIDTFRKEYQV